MEIDGYLSRREVLSKIFRCLVTIPIFSFSWVSASSAKRINRDNSGKEPIQLPQPRTDGDVSLEICIKNRRTIRSFSKQPLTLGQISQLLWAAQGITEDRGFKRAAPSAGALYPIDIYTVVGKKCVKDFKEGVYHYAPGNHVISRINDGDLRDQVAKAALRQMWMANAPVNMVITAEYGRTTVKYGNRGVRYAMIEAGHVGQNIFLQAGALGLAAGIVGAFYDDRIIKTLNISESHNPLLVMPVGYQS